MTRGELLDYLARLDAVKTTKPGVYKVAGMEIVVRPLGGGNDFDVREVKCDC